MKKLLKLSATALAFVVFVGTAMAAQCLGTTRQGNRCKNHASAGSNYCRYHDPAVKHCVGINKDGTTCRNVPVAGSAYCSVHKR